MTSSDILFNTWVILKNEPHEVSGSFERRIFANTRYSLFAGISKPSDLVNFSLVCATGQSSKIQEQELQGFKLVKEILNNELTKIRIELTQKTYRDIFQWVASDIVDKLLEYNNEKEAALILDKRIEHWKKFIQASGPNGLNRNTQIGLFGELLTLRSQLNFSTNKTITLDAWLGPESSNHDFVLGLTALEVKTTTGNEPTRVHISNEYQLDTTGFQHLFLCHIRLDEKQGGGLSLPVLIDEIMNELPEVLKITFTDSLTILGYLDRQRGLYESIGYFERSRTFYAVSEGFPMITRELLALGISQVLQTYFEILK